MLNNLLFVSESLNGSLFYLRTIRNFCLNIQLSFFKNNEEYSKQAETLRKRCEELGRKLIEYTEGKVNEGALNGGLFVTEFTLQTEELTEKLFDISLATDITKEELSLQPGTPEEPTIQLVNNLYEANEEAKKIVQDFLSLAAQIKEKMNNNELFSYTYPSFYQYMITVATTYLNELTRLNDKEATDPTASINNRYQFNMAMYEILLFLRGLINTTEMNYITQIESLLEKYIPLLEDYRKLPLTPINQKNLTNRSVTLTKELKDLLAKMITDLLNAKLYFIIEAVALDNFYTDINYFYYTLQIEQNYQNTLN